MSNAVIYARFSSYGQREESIEGQLAACRKYADQNDLVVVNEYVDRAASATNDRREQFQRMIFDAENEDIDAVLVYQLDRFARNRYDATYYRRRLRDCGVKLISVSEPIADDPSGVFLEALLEAQAEFYSADLSRKVKRGQKTNAEKCLYNGAIVPFGYRIDEEKRYQLHEENASVVKRIFDRFMAGASMVDIAAELNAAGIRGFRGAAFNKKSVRKILGNLRYTGTYIFGETVVPDGIPAIVDQEVFDAVQARMKARKRVRGGSENYLLAGKLFCGNCERKMVGVSGTSKTGDTHYYYSCKGKREKACDRKSIRRDVVDDAVVQACRDVLSDENIAEIAKAVALLSERESISPYLKQLKKELRQTDKAIENLLKALELGQEADLLLSRISENRSKKEEIEKQIAKEEFANQALSEPEVSFFLNKLKAGDINEEKYRRMLVSVLVNRAVYCDDFMVVYFNAGKNSAEVTAEYAISDSGHEKSSNKGIVAEE